MLQLPRVALRQSQKNISLNFKEVKLMLQPTGNKLIDTIIYVGASALIFNGILPIFALIIELFNVLM